MSKKKSFGIPVVAALFLAVGLGIVVDDPFGKDLAAYVGAVSTLALVAVTISYVVATYEIAQTSAEQLALKKSQRGMDAVTELWADFKDSEMLAHHVIIDANTMHVVVKRDMSRFPVINAEAENRRAELAGFSRTFNRLSLHLPDTLVEPGERLIGVYTDVYMLGSRLSDEVRRAVAQSNAEGTEFDAQRIGATWDLLGELIYDDLPPWDKFDLSPMQQALESAMSTFRAAAQQYVKQGL